jgi:predicted naringenin-chalcone synthase
MSSASIMFVFEELLRHTPQNEPRPGAAVAFGPGLTIKSLEFTLVPQAQPGFINLTESGEAALSPAI